MKKGKNKKVLLTGGHAGSTGYAVIQEAKAKDKKWDLYWIGASSAVEGKRTKTLEERIFSKIDIKFVPIKAGRAQTKFTIWTIPSFLKIPIGCVQSFIKLIQIRPDVVLSFGGYVAVPVVFNAWILGIPVIIHEQTAAVGRANLFSKYFAKKILISRIGSQKYFPPEKTIFSGNPISAEVRKIKPKAKKSSPPVVLVAGGSRGSLAINDCVGRALEKILKDFSVVHQTGEISYEKFTKVKNKLPNNLRKRYQVVGILEPWDWYKKMEKCDIVVSRSGANTVSEVIIARRPAIFIPLPIAYKKEQLENARFVAEKGAAEILAQDDLSEKTLLKNLQKVSKNWDKMYRSFNNIKNPDAAAAENVVEEIERIIEK